jgi:pentose-5-phosphate-3-epimerase
MKEVIPTIVPASFDDVRSAAERYSFAPVIHIDAGDGKFVPNTTWQPQDGDVLPTPILWEAHLMLAEPLESGIRYAKAGASRIIAHFEAFPEPALIAAAFASWKTAGAREVGLAAKIGTPLESLTPYVSLCDSVVLMTIASIGQQGSSFDPRGIDRIRALHTQFPSLSIAADGGINESNIAGLAQAGATRFCVGTALASSADPEAVYKRLLDAVGTVQ